jgi:AcrR family transcriptional regulator
LIYLRRFCGLTTITDTQQKLLDAGKKEFLAKGFKSASLRKIVKDAGFTLGAFYGYYTDKNSLFDALVEPAAGELIRSFKAACDQYFDLLDTDRTRESRQMSTEYLRQFLAFVYDNFDAFSLVLCRSEGTKYQDYVHRLVKLEIEQSEIYIARLRELGRVEGDVSPEVRHMLTDAYFNCVFETVVHNMNRKKAMGYVEQIARFFNSGWDSLLKFT